MPAPLRLRLRLDQTTREAVAERYEHTRGAVERTNCQSVLLADEGRHAPEVAWLVRRGPHQVRKVLRRFQAEGLAGRVPRKAPGRAVQVPPSWLSELQRAVTQTDTRETLRPLLEDADVWARTISPIEILRQIGSPFADTDLTHDQDLAHAA